MAILGMQVVLRLITGGESTPDGVNVFIHLLIWIAALLWLLSQALKPSWTFRLTGVELFLVGFAALSLVSFLNASYKLPALIQCFAFASFALMFVIVVQHASESTSRGLITLIGATVLVISVYGILQRLFLLEEMRHIDFSKTGLPEESREEWTWRVSGNEIFSTFHSSNTLAGFLVMTIPLILGWIMDSWKAMKQPGAFGASLFSWALLSCAALAFFWTGSLGGWMALIGAAWFAVSFHLSQRSERWKKIFRTGLRAMIAGAVLLVLMTAFWRNGPTRVSQSLAVRGTYWNAAAHEIMGQPFFGVGLRNFGDHSTANKPAEPEESRHAHNDYLELWAEVGLFGLILFIGTWFYVLRKFVRARSVAPDDTIAGSALVPWPWLIGGLLAFGTAWLTQQSFTERPALMAAMVLLWGGFFIVSSSTVGTNSPFITLGLAAGMVGFLIHILVDYDFYVPGTAETIFLLAALLMIRLRPSAVRTYELPPSTAWGAAVFILIVITPLLGSFLPGLLESNHLLEEARDHVARKEWKEAEQAYNSAMQNNPLDAEVHAEIGEFYFGEYQRARTEGQPGRTQAMLDICLSAAHTMIQLRPYNASFHHLAAQWYREAYLLNRQRKLVPGSMEYAKAVGFQQSVLVEMSLAVTYYPTDAMYRFEYAAMLEESGDLPRAMEHYREALRLHDLYQAREKSTKRVLPKRFFLNAELEKRARDKTAAPPKR